MQHFHYTATPQATYPVVILVTQIRKDEIKQEYMSPFGIEDHDALVITLHQEPGKKKTKAAEMQRYIKEELEPVLKDVGAKYLVVGDSDYFKQFTKVDKSEANLGYVLDCVFGAYKVVYVPNYRTVFYDPVKIRPKIAQGMNALVAHAQNTYEAPGTDIIQYAAYPKTDDEIAHWLWKLMEMDCPLAIDIEAFDLKPQKAGIGTISFAWSDTEGIAFPVDYVPIYVSETIHGIQVRNETRRVLLKMFFEKMLQKTMYHNISYDACVLIYQLYMDNITDTEGLLLGMDTILKNWDDTKLITYLATNSCAGNKLSLKEQAQEYSGNYAQKDINDICKIPLDELLKYNLVDSLSTWFVHKKWWGKLVNDQQEDIYQTLFKPSILDIVQMQLTGMPIDINRVAEVKAILVNDQDNAIIAMSGTSVIQQFTHLLNEKYVNKMNAKWVKKRITVGEAEEVFNPNSGPQLQTLLFEMLGLPILSYTDSKQPSTDGDVLAALVNHTTDPTVIVFLKALIDYKSVNKILTSFIPAMENAMQGPDGWNYLFGNFNLGGALSGRLSSSGPNLQTIPANSKYAKLIKSCFVPPPGWLFCGLDFASLEDRISALTTKDPAKLKVYAGSKQFDLTVNGVTHRILEEDVVSYDGQQLTGLELYEKLQSSKP